MIGVLIVVYRPQLPELRAALMAVADAADEGVPICVRVWHNDAGVHATDGLGTVYETVRRRGVPVTVGGGHGNLGFGKGINALASMAKEPFLLVLNQDAIPESGSLRLLWATATTDAGDVAAWEMRQIPYEHPKDYDPVALATGWCSGAALLLRAGAFRAVGGFEPRIFMYGEDVDLSWRLRCAGWRLRYLPQCAVVHRTYGEPEEIKPLLVLEGCYANLCLRARFGSTRQIWEGLTQLWREVRGPQAFPGRRRGLLRAGLKFLRHAFYFRRTRCCAPGFSPCFRAWDYEWRRSGAFHVFRAKAETTSPRPRVTAIITRSGDPGDLRRTLACIARQTWSVFEVIVVDPGAGDRADLVAAFADQLDLRQVPTHIGADKSAALASALGMARGDWVAMVDADSTLLYADHLEVLLQAAGDGNVQAARGLRRDAAPEYATEDGPLSSRGADESTDRPGLAIVLRLDLARKLCAAHADWSTWADPMERVQLADVPKLTSLRLVAGAS